MDFTLSDGDDLLYSDDEQGSPEYLPPIKDPYSSDCETETKRAKYLSCDVPPKTLVHDYNIRYCPMPSILSSEEMEKVDIPTIVETIMYFVTCRKDINGNELIKKVEDCTRRNDHLRYYHKNKNYDINFKEIDTCPYVLSEENISRDDLGTIEGQVIDFLTTLVDIMTNTYQNKSFCRTSQHKVAKMCMFRYCSLIGEDIMQDSTAQCRLRPPKPGLCTVVTQPDLVITGGRKSCPGIPVEVFSQNEGTCTEPVYNHNAEEANIQSKSVVGVTIEKLEANDELLNFIFESTPVGPKSMDCNFKLKLASKHVLQIVAAAAHCIMTKCFKSTMERYRTRAFIGLYVVNEYVYMAKVVSNELNLAKLGMMFEIPDDPLQKLLWIKGKIDPFIYVQFLPTAFDLSRHNHRIALLLFLKYYKYHWEELQVDPIVLK